jgi:Family of unknown function (DUF6941)
VRVTLLLADAAQPAGSAKVSALGLGWSATSSPTTPMALVVLIDLDQDEYGRHEFRVWLSPRGEDAAVKVKGADGDAALEFGGAFEVQAPDEVVEDVPARVNLALNVAPSLPVSPGRVYEWRAEIDGVRNEAWSVPFYVRPEPSNAPDAGTEKREPSLR